jgi:hypothetical protein
MGLRRFLAAASFLAYATAAIVATHNWPASWPVERELSIPAAISNVVYGLQLGLIDSNVLAEFHKVPDAAGVNPKSIEDAVDLVARGDTVRGHTVTSVDPIGIGQLLFIDLAMRLFGPHISSMPYFFLLLMGFAALSFVGRYDDGRLIFVPLYFTALTCMLLTPLLTDPVIRDQAPIGGNRFFGILGIIPALHIFFEFAGGVDRRNFKPWKNWAPLVVQSALLTLVLLVRSADAYLLAPPIYAAISSVRHGRDNRVWRGALYRKLGYVAITGIVCASALIASVPNYAKSGRIGGTVWHRAFVSYVAHPEWPFGNLRDVYDCTRYIPEGLYRGRPADRNGHCVWWTYPPNQTRPIQEVQDGTYGPEYEAVLRRAYFNVILSYPRQAVELFVYYKPALIAATLRDGLVWRLALIPPSILLLLVLQASLFTWFVAVSAPKTPFIAKPTFGTLVLFAFFAILPQLLGLTSLWVAADVVLYMYAAFGLVFALVVQNTSRAWFPRFLLPDRLR